jgi:hypothetical protein
VIGSVSGKRADDRRMGGAAVGEGVLGGQGHGAIVPTFVEAG